MNDTWLITGGSGFIGSNFINLVLSETAKRVVNLDKLTYAGNPDNLANLPDPSRHDFIQGDIGDRNLVRDLLREHRPVAVINLAAETHVDRSIDSPADFLETNVMGTHVLLGETLDYWEGRDAGSRAQFRFLHVSTDEVFGDLGPDDPAFTETSVYRPNSPYSASKAAADHLVRAYHRTYGLPTLITNSSNNYGPCQHPEKLIPLAISKALSGNPIPLYGDGKQVRDWIHVEDHCRGILRTLIAGRPGESYNIGGNCEKTNLEIVKNICDILDHLRPMKGTSPRTDLIVHVADRPGHDRRYSIDIGKISRELGWSPMVTFVSGMERTVRWFLKNEHRLIPGIGYGGERLGLSRVRPG